LVLARYCSAPARLWASLAIRLPFLLFCSWRSFLKRSLSSVSPPCPLCVLVLTPPDIRALYRTRGCRPLPSRRPMRADPLFSFLHLSYPRPVCSTPRAGSPRLFYSPDSPSRPLMPSPFAPWATKSPFRPPRGQCRATLVSWELNNDQLMHL
jgi:hypothetical protein